MEFRENKPIYLQLADQLLDEVERGQSSGGDRLLSVREYAGKTGVNVNTVMRAYNWLQQEDVIFNRRGIGYFFADDARERVLNMRRREFWDKELPYFIDRMRALEISPEEIMKKIIQNK
ncbi:MAG: GntR family transcriptional regulator [Muribaculaceae bacterium]|nr:GntR family transcriptional regulator [Muribaculaceae bacterium]